MKTRKQPKRQARQSRVKSDRQIKQPKLKQQIQPRSVSTSCSSSRPGQLRKNRERNQDDRRFKKHRPYLLELDEIFKHMEDIQNMSSCWDSSYSNQYRCLECRQSVTSQSKNPKNPTVAEAIELVKECGVEEESHLFHTATKAMFKPEAREMFASIKTERARLLWLQHEHDEKISMSMMNKSSH